jgi:hypothetical protein
LQNFDPSGFWVPQDGQAAMADRAAAHSLQNFDPPGFSAPQDGQVAMARPYFAGGPMRLKPLSALSGTPHV